MKFVRRLLIMLALVAVWAPAGAQEKFKFGSAVKLFPQFYLPILAGVEQGIFKRNGVDVEWFPFQSGADMHRAFAASAIKIAASQATGDVLGVARGLPVVMVAELQRHDDFAVWVSAKGKIQKVEDLKGARIGVSRMGGGEHAYGQLVAKRLGIGGDVRFVSTGGIKESLAVLLTGGIDAVVLPAANMVDLMLEGRVKSIAKIKDYLPSSWAAFSILAHKDFVEKDPETAKRVIRSIVEANRFVMSPAGKPWVIAKMRELNGYTPEAAEIVYSTLDLSQTGEISAEAVKNLSSFMVEHELLKATEAPPLDKIFTDRFVK